MFWQNHRAVAKESHSANRVTQLAQISWPVVLNQFLHGFRMNGRNVFAFFSPGGSRFCGDQCRQLFKPFSKRRNKQGETVDSLIKVFAEFPQPDPFSQRTVRGADKSRVRSEHSL